MKIAIIGAMEEEVALLKNTINNLTTEQHGGFQYYLGQIENHNIILLKSGIGKVNAAIGTALLLKLYQPDYVINTGSAGGFHADLNVGDIIISEAVCHHDVDLTPFNYELGQVPGMPTKFMADKYLVEIAKQSIEELNEVKYMYGLIATGDRFMYKPADVQTTQANFPEMIACEMEAAAIAQTCHAFITPFIIIRSLSDIAGKDNASSFEKYLDQAATHSAKLILVMLKKIKK